MIVIDVDAPTVDATHLACVQRVFPCLLPANTPLPHSVTASVHPTWQHVPLNGDGFDRIAERCIALLDGGRAGVVVDFSDSSLVLSLVAAAQQSSKNSYSDHVLYLAEQLIERFSLPPARLVFRLTDHVQAGIAQAFIDLGFSVWLPSIPEQLSCSSKLWLAASAKDKKDPSIVTIVPYSSIPLKNMPASLAALFISTLRTDRDDGLYTTVVVDEHQVCLGLVYSSLQSIETAIVEGAGVYYSRSRQQLWRKGETSGAVQQLLRMDADCDGDALRFVVKQSGPGFCHLNTATCFGNTLGLPSLMQTLNNRLENPEPKSYTAKLFSDANLLHAKIREEAQELCDAKTKEDIAWETADLFYFALAKCVKNGVSLSDVEEHLNRRAFKVTRRPGHAKPQFLPSATSSQINDGPVNNSSNTSQSKPDSSTEIKLASAKNLYQLKIVQANNLSEEERQQYLKRPIMDTESITSRVVPILEQVKQRGDAALLELTKRFDNVILNNPVLEPPFGPHYATRLDSNVRRAIDVAFDNIYKFHLAQLGPCDQGDGLSVETMPGVVCSRFSRPIERVGLYVPGGSAVLPSTALMLGIPAMVAGCQQIILATPPGKDGIVCPEVLYVAEKVGARKVVLAGGAQAIAAMAYGTESVPKVDKICGPGNQYVTAAKMLVQNDSASLVSIDMPAGPSEVLVIADSKANASFVASDLLSQAEHGPDSQVVLLTVNLSSHAIQAIQDQVTKQAELLPRRDIVRQSLSKSYILSCSNLDEAIQFSNAYAPEHLILHLENPREVLPKISNAGSVFLGPYSAESCGDYASGTNHTLPTYGYARMYSGVNTHSFMKHITAQEVSAEGLLGGLGEVVATLAGVEQLDAHRNAVLIRLEHLRGLK